jgi:glycosyl transferase family 25
MIARVGRAGDGRATMRVLINLEAAQERRARMLRQADSLGVSFVRVGFDGRGSSASALAAEVAARVPRVTFDTRALSGAEVGCWVSHLTAWQALLARPGDAAATVIEDDLVLHPAFDRVCRALEAGSGYDVVFLGTSSRNLSTRRSAALGALRLHEPVGAIYNTWGYVIARRYAAWFLAQPRRILWPIDHVLGGRIRALAPRRAVVQPAVVAEDPDTGRASQIEPTTFRLDRARLVEEARRRLLASRVGDLYYRLYRYL